MSSILPQELCDQVIDELSDDFETLTSCALTCHAWIERSRSYIHRSTNFRGDWWELPSLFLEFLRMSPVLKYVKRVKIALPMDCQTDMLIAFFDTFAARLPALQELSASGNFWDPLCHDTLGTFCTRLPFRITHDISPKLHEFQSLFRLVLCGIGFASSQDLVRMLCGLPRLSSLALKQVHRPHGNCTTGALRHSDGTAVRLDLRFLQVSLPSLGVG